MMTEYIYREGNIAESNEGDIIVPDVPDAYGWQSEALLFDHIGDEAAAARSVVDLEGQGGVAETVVGEKDLQERLAEAGERIGFKPTTHQELNDIVSLTGQDLIKGSATLLSRIQRKQIKVNKDTEARNKDLPKDRQIEIDPNMPRRTVESIVGRYISYAESAFSQARLLLNLTDMISAREAKRSEQANTIPMLQDWSMDGSTRAPIMALLKADDIKAFLIGNGEDASPLKAEYRKLSDAQLRAMGDTFIGSMKIGELQDLIAENVAEQRKRFSFWTNTLKEAQINNAAKASAVAGLEKFKL